MKITGVNIVWGVLLLLSLQSCREKNGYQLSPEDIYDNGDLHVITSWFNDKRHTTSVLYGNVMTDTIAIEGEKHIPGEQYTLVTWHQQNNPLWFGSQISERVATIELVTIVTDDAGYIVPQYNMVYHAASDSISGTQLEQERIDYILSRKGAQYPG